MDSNEEKETKKVKSKLGIIQLLNPITWIKRNQKTTTANQGSLALQKTPEKNDAPQPAVVVARISNEVKKENSSSRINVTPSKIVIDWTNSLKRRLSISERKKKKEEMGASLTPKKDKITKQEELDDKEENRAEDFPNKKLNTENEEEENSDNAKMEKQIRPIPEDESIQKADEADDFNVYSIRRNSEKKIRVQIDDDIEKRATEDVKEMEDSPKEEFKFAIELDAECKRTLDYFDKMTKHMVAPAKLLELEKTGTSSQDYINDDIGKRFTEDVKEIEDSPKEEFKFAIELDAECKRTLDYFDKMTKHMVAPAKLLELEKTGTSSQKHINDDIGKRVTEDVKEMEDSPKEEFKFAIELDDKSKKLLDCLAIMTKHLPRLDGTRTSSQEHINWQEELLVTDIDAGCGQSRTSLAGKEICVNEKSEVNGEQTDNNNKELVQNNQENNENKEENVNMANQLKSTPHEINQDNAESKGVKKNYTETEEDEAEIGIIQAASLIIESEMSSSEEKSCLNEKQIVDNAEELVQNTQNPENGEENVNMMNDFFGQDALKLLDEAFEKARKLRARETNLEKLENLFKMIATHLQLQKYIEYTDPHRFILWEYVAADGKSEGETQVIQQKQKQKCEIAEESLSEATYCKSSQKERDEWKKETLENLEMIEICSKALSMEIQEESQTVENSKFEEIAYSNQQEDDINQENVVTSTNEELDPENNDVDMEESSEMEHVAKQFYPGENEA